MEVSDQIQATAALTPGRNCCTRSTGCWVGLKAVWAFRRT